MNNEYERFDFWNRELKKKLEEIAECATCASSEPIIAEPIIAEPIIAEQ